MRKTSFSVKCSLISAFSSRADCEVVTERLLDHEPDPALRRAALADVLDERADRGRRHREVVEAVAHRAALLVELVQRLDELVLAMLVGEVERRVAHAVRELRPHLLVERIARVILDRLLHPLAEVVVALRCARRADDRELLRQQPAERERVQRRDQLLRRQVAGRAEDDEDARVRPPPNAQPFGQRILLRRRHYASGFTA